MDKDELFYLALDLQEGLNSVPKSDCRDKSRVDLLAETVDTLQLAYTATNRRGNALMLSPSAGCKERKSLMLVANLDEPAPATAILAAFLYFATNGLRSSFNLLLAAGSAGNLKNILEEVGNIDLAMVAAPTGMNPVVAQSGRLLLDALVDTDLTYSQGEEGRNAIYKAMPVIAALRSLRLPEASPWLGPVKISVNAIEAHGANHAAPTRCRFSVQADTTECCDNADTLDLLRASVPSYCSFTVIDDQIKPAYISADNPLVSRLITLGRQPQACHTPGLAAFLRCPVLTLGPGRHGEQPTCDDAQMREAIEIYTTLLR